MKFRDQFSSGELEALIEQAQYGDDHQRAFAMEMLADAPSIDPHYQIWMRYYERLSTNRPIALDGMAPIPHDAMIRFADEIGLRGRERETLYRIMIAVDEHIVGEANRRLSESRKRASSRS